MARKVIKISRSKGERLGWTPLDKVKHVTLSSVTVKGRRITMRSVSGNTGTESSLLKFLVP